MIEIILYSAAGFLIAALIALITVPYMVGHASKTGARNMRDSMPLSTSESLADKDQLRAEHAVEICKLQSKIDKQVSQISQQDIELDELSEKIIAANKIAKAGKLALEEMRSKDMDLNDRLRQRDAEYAGLEQRSRRMLRENRDLKLALRKEEKNLNSIAKINAASGNQPLKQPTVKTTLKTKSDISEALDKERAKNITANKKIQKLQEELFIALNKPGMAAEKNSSKAKGKKSIHLPKANLPSSLGGEKVAQISEMDSKAISELQDELFNMTATMAQITATLEGDKSQIVKILEAADQTNDDSLAAKMRAAIAKAGLSEQAKSDAKTKTTAKKPSLPKAKPLPKITVRATTKQSAPAKGTTKTTAKPTAKTATKAATKTNQAASTRRSKTSGSKAGQTEKA